MLSLLEEITKDNPHFQKLFLCLDNAVSLKSVVIAALRLGLTFAVIIAEEVLTTRGENMNDHYLCPKCESPLESKGLVKRSMTTLIGMLSWKRRVRRCPKGCEIGQIAPFDEELKITPYQRHSEELKQLACLLAIFLPFGLSVILLKIMIGVKVTPATIWNWVQCAGKKAKKRIEKELEDLNEDVLPKKEQIETLIEQLPLIIGGDGVMVPFRPNGGSPKGKTVWREVKIGIFARLGQRITKKGKQVSIIVRRRLVAVLGDINCFKTRMWLTAIKEGIHEAEVVVWLSDGGRGFWGVFNELFSGFAQGILDYYHAAQNLWKGARAWFDGRTKKARLWFSVARQLLLLGKANEFLDEIKEGLESKNLSDSVRKTLENLICYLEGHSDHINYDLYRQLGLPIGSGMVESACKWLIQQRFKCVGMRWSEDGFNNLLHLRLAWVNENYDDLFEKVSFT